jgi:membrane protease YdiL (CAAX protease family)
LTRAWLRLAAATAFALVVFRTVDSGLYRLTRDSLPSLALLADVRIPSLALIAALVLAGDARARLAWPRRDTRTLPWIAGWLGGMLVSVHFFGVGRIPLPRWQDTVAFNLTGPLAEELLIRGLVLSAAERVMPAGRALVFSALVFALMHLQYHAFRIDAASCAQLAWTFPFGILLAWLAQRTGSLWPSLALHWLNNALVRVV